MKPIALIILLILVTSSAQAQWQVKQIVDPMTEVRQTIAWTVDASRALEVSFRCYSGVLDFELTTLRSTDWLHSNGTGNAMLRFRAGTDSAQHVVLVQSSANGLHDAYTIIPDSQTAANYAGLGLMDPAWLLLKAFGGKHRVAGAYPARRGRAYPNAHRAGLRSGRECQGRVQAVMSLD